ncbi:inositol monophosphatase family protein [Cohaesibacter intestini]|uniref:inositol monophosphatase family protein n=1 Tax=Cohaesibacter intestini TaxID=2211145 RepID=UPI000DEB1BC6|nr:inositol monophosphatase family protein [Cohaesibacter intestini]
MIEERYALLQTLAKEAGQLALNHLQALKDNRFPIEVKGPQDFVTKADRDVETFIRTKLKEAFPEDGLLGEEHGLEAGSNGFTWVIDPIDGTANYIRSIDQWAISIGLVSADRMEAGVIYDPMRDDLYRAAAAQGAFLNDSPLAKAKTEAPTDPILILGRSKRKPFDSYLKTLSFLESKGIEYRRFGSAAMGLALVATGQVDGYFEADLNPWDCMAGLLIIKEMGGVIAAGEQAFESLQNQPICAVHPYMRDEMTALLAVIAEIE